MRIETVAFECSAARVEDAPRNGRPEIAVSGRSNVGKSSLLNMLLGRKGLARVSGTPGKTQLLNYFLVNDRFYLVDLPGYGFARAPADVQQRWRRMMQGYLRRRRELRAVLQLVDPRHAPSPLDVDMVRWLLDEAVPFCLVPTKMDKLRRGERGRALAGWLHQVEVPADLPVVPTSSRTGEGRRELLAYLQHVLTREPPFSGGPRRSHGGGSPS